MRLPRGRCSSVLVNARYIKDRRGRRRMWCGGGMVQRRRTSEGGTTRRVGRSSCGGLDGQQHGHRCRQLSELEKQQGVPTMMKMMKQRLLLLRCWLMLLKTLPRTWMGCAVGGVGLGGALATGRTTMCASRAGQEAVT